MREEEEEEDPPIGDVWNQHLIFLEARDKKAAWKKGIDGHESIFGRASQPMDRYPEPLKAMLEPKEVLSKKEKQRRQDAYEAMVPPRKETPPGLQAWVHQHAKYRELRGMPEAGGAIEPGTSFAIRAVR